MRPEVVAVHDHSVDVTTSDIHEPLVVGDYVERSVEVLVRAAGGINGGIRFSEPEFQRTQDGVRIYRIPHTICWTKFF